MDAGPVKRKRGQPEFNRRTLLIGAGAAAGLAIGYAVWPRSVPLNLATRKGETLINGWLKIASDGRCIVAVPQAEMGQGVYTALPQLLAHELGADWRMVAVEPAPLHPIYANRAFAGDSDGSFIGGIKHWAMVEVIERYAVQVTGGSTSVMSFWEPLRTAGAAAREMLCRAAARRLGVDAASCDTEAGYVVSGKRRVAFAELLADVDVGDAPEAPTLRGDGEGRLLGTPAPRLDVPAKVDGSAAFGADIRLPGMVYAAVRGAPLGAGPLAGASLPPQARKGGVMELVQGPDWYATVADTWWAARQALDNVEASFGDGDLADSARIDAALEAALRGDTGTAFTDRGDVEAALAAGPVLEAVYSVPFLAHACLEPMTATARVQNGHAEVWVPTQSASLVNWRVADTLGIPEAKVTVYPTLLGGGFGRKAEVDSAVQAARIARDVGRPVQLIWHREEDIARDKYRPAATARLRGRVGADKRIAGWDIKLAAPNLSESFNSRVMPAMARGGDSADMLEGAALPYDVQAFRAAHAEVPTPVPVGYWRSVGHSYNAFFSESFVDELAEAAGSDPLDFRLRLLAGNNRVAEVLKTAASRGSFLAGGEDNIGRGLAIHSSFGSTVAQVVEVSAPSIEEIAVRRVTCVIDCGRVVNPGIVRQQMEGAIIFALTAALRGEIRFEKGESQQTNFDSYALLGMAEAPDIDIYIVPSTESPGGVGEPGVPPLAPALANAIYAATGERIRQLPIFRF